MGGILSKTLSGLTNGVSQQAPDIRLDSQCDLQENAVSSLVHGLYKRPPAELVAKLGSFTGDVFIHEMIRDGDEQYILVIDSDPNFPIKVFTLDGVQCEVNYNVSIGYLSANSVSSAFKAHTISDVTIISNSEVLATASTELSGEYSFESTAIVCIDSGLQETEYKVLLNGNIAASLLTGDSVSQQRTTWIAQQLVDMLTTNAGQYYTFDIKGNSIRIQTRDGAAFSCTTEDSWGNQAMSCSQLGVSSVNDLPSECWEDTLMYVKGLGTTSSKAYYRFSEEGSGAWTEALAPSIQYKFDATTLPHKLSRTAYNTFTFDVITWEEQETGDGDTNPMPSFIGSYITDVFTFRNRFGVLSGENIILSRAGDYFNFFSTSVLDVLDDDPIDVAISADDVNILRHAKPFQETLMVTSDLAQFSLTSGDNTLTPSSAVVSSTTRFEAEPVCPPVGVGANLYFVQPKNQYSSLREYYVQPDTLVNDAADVTIHAPEYLPKGITHLTACTAMDVIFAFSPGDPKSVYVYQFYWNGDEKAQSAWHKWVFSYDIVSIHAFKSFLYIVFKVDGQTYLTKVDIEKTTTPGLTFRVSLDFLTSVSGTSSFQLPFNDGTQDWLLIDPDTGLEVDNQSCNSGVITVPAEVPLKDYWLGKTYTMRYRFSEWGIKAPNTNVSTLGGVLVSRSITLSYRNTSHFDLEITPYDRDTFTTRFSTVELGMLSELNTVALHSGHFRELCMGDAIGLKVEIVSDSHLPCQFQTATWEGYFNQRSTMI